MPVYLSTCVLVYLYTYAMKITKEAVKAWKAEYDLINTAEREELKAYLPTLTVEESLRLYFELCRMMISISGSTEEPVELQGLRARHQMDVIAKWTRLAERLKDVT